MSLSGKYLLRLVAAYVLAVLCFMLSVLHIDGLTLDALLAFTLGGAVFSPDAYIPTLVLGAAPLLVLCYLFSDFMRADLGRTAVYVFSRTKRRSRWVLRKLTALFLVALVESAAVFTTLVLVFSVLYRADDLLAQLAAAIRLFAFLVALDTLYAAASLILVNLLALRFGALRSFIAFAFLHLFGLFASMSLPRDGRHLAVHVLPFAQGVFAWHDAPGLVGSSAGALFSSGAVPGFSLGYSYGYLIALVLIEAFVGMYLIRRLDLV